MWRYQSSGKIVEQTSCPNEACRSSDAFTVYDDGHSHCYSCGHHVLDEASLDTVKASLRKEIKSENIQLPPDYDDYMPDEPRAWLAKFDLTWKEIRRNKIGWSDLYESIVFPVFAGSELVLWQRRYFGTNPKIPKWVTKGHRDVIHLPDEWKNDDLLVIVEDIISAIKVSRVTNCMPMMGSSMTPEMTYRLPRLFKRARTWLDPDAKAKSLKAALGLSELGLPTTVIFTDRDPKYFGTADIRRIVDPKE